MSSFSGGKGQGESDSNPPPPTSLPTLATTSTPTLTSETTKQRDVARNPKADVVAGFMSGVFCRLIAAPFDVLKIRFQLQKAPSATSSQKYTSIAQAFRAIVKDEGILSLWKGNWPATYLWVTFGTVQFGCYGIFKSYFESVDSLGSFSSRSTALSSFAAGAFAGTIATGLTYPFDIMRTQFAIQGQNRKFRSQLAFMTHVYKEIGVKGFFVGAFPALMGTLPYMGLNFAIYEYLKVKMSQFLSSRSSDDESDQGGHDNNTGKKNSNLSEKSKGTFFIDIINSTKLLLDSSFCGAIAGGVSKFAVYPLDTIKRRIQSQILLNTFDVNPTSESNEATTRLRYKGIIDCARQVYSSEGVRGLYKGLIPSVMKSVTSTGVAFASYEFFVGFALKAFS